MKKYCLAILFLLTALLLIACGQGATTHSVPEATPSPEEIGVSEVLVDKAALSIPVAQSETVSVSVLPEDAQNKKLSYLVTDPSVAYVDQQGKVTGLSTGETTLRIKAASGVLTECKITVTERGVDPVDELDLSTGEELWWTSCHGNGIDIDKTGNILFTPNIWSFSLTDDERRRLTAYLRFTYVPEDESESEYVFPSVRLAPEYAEEGYMIFTLQSKNSDSGFCPRNKCKYKVEMILTAGAQKRVAYYGTFEVRSSADVIQYSPCYRPTPYPGMVDKTPGQALLNYLPLGGGTVSGLPAQKLFTGETGSSVTAVASPGYRFYSWSDGKTEATRTDAIGEKNLTVSAYFVKDGAATSPVADMYLFTESGKPVTKKSYEGATMLVVGAKDPRYNIQKHLQIKGRGNSSWNGDAEQDDYDSKNSYKIKFDEKEHLLGIGDSKNKDWVLNSNKFDLSGLRNYLVWELADKMGNFGYVTDCTWVNLYVNCQYRGMYMVTEQVEIANDRIELDDSGSSAEKGYFIEIDFRGDGETNPYFHVKGYGKASNNNEREFVVKSECTKEDLAYITSYIQLCHDTIVSGDKKEIEKLVDLKSLVDMYIIEELSKDVDVGAASFFIQKDPGGKLYFTAPWDYDFGFGTFEKAVKNTGMISVNKGGCTWFAALLDRQWFRDMVLARMAELDGAFEETIDAVYAKAQVLKPYADENAYFWDMYGKHYHGYVDRQVSSYLYSYDEHVSFLADWSTQRWQNMKDFIKTHQPQG